MPGVVDQAVESAAALKGHSTAESQSDPAIVDDTRALVVDLLTVAEAGKMLRVSDATIRNWIEADCIPYVKLPGPPGTRKQHRIPLQGLLSALGGTYDLRSALTEQNARMRAADLPED